MPVKDYDDLAGEQLLDSRDLIEALEDLREQVDAHGPEWDLEDVEQARERIREIEALEDSSEDWLYGATFIREDHFTEYAQELAEDIGAISSDNQWPLYCIDWERAARELAMDYTSVTFAGHDYYVR